jgi:hypothetical protein
MSVEKCPYCYRPINTHNHDPILIPNGAKYKWKSDTELIEVPNIEDRIYKGLYQINETDVIELQDELKVSEEANLLEINRTVFSPLNVTGKFQIIGNHIKEMRDSVEKLLVAIGSTKIDYFNSDDNGTHIIHPNGDKLEWTDPITEATDLQKFQVKNIHIEDLRHYIQTMWMEDWVGLDIDFPPYPEWPSQFQGRHLWAQSHWTNETLRIYNNLELAPPIRYICTEPNGGSLICNIVIPFNLRIKPNSLFSITDVYSYSPPAFNPPYGMQENFIIIWFKNQNDPNPIRTYPLYYIFGNYPHLRVVTSRTDFWTVYNQSLTQRNIYDDWKALNEYLKWWHRDTGPGWDTVCQVGITCKNIYGYHNTFKLGTIKIYSSL